MTEQQQHPITPPPELVQQWRNAAPPLGLNRENWIATQAARWGADQELEACIDAIARHPGFESPELFVEVLRAARRPQPLSLKQQALEAPESLGGMNDKLHRDLDELHSIACAAAHALKCVDVMLDSGAAWGYQQCAMEQLREASRELQAFGIAPSSSNREDGPMFKGSWDGAGNAP